MIPYASNISYSSISAAQKLDIYLPLNGTEPFPLVIFIHGGAFLYGDKADQVYLDSFPYILERGYAVASINYRLSGEAKFPALVQDAKAAVRWLRANAAKYKLDPERFAAWGSSAGGYLVAMLGTTGHIADFDDETLGNQNVSSRVQAVVDWYGPTNFLKMDEQLAAAGCPESMQTHNNADSPESLLLGKPITEQPELVKIANPINYISGDAPPFLIQHGSADCIVPPLQSWELYYALLEVIGAEKVTMQQLEGAGHGTPEFTSDENMSIVVQFLNKHMSTKDEG